MREIPVLYKRKEECCGCTACYASCSQNAISMVVDEEGFEYPQIDVNTEEYLEQLVKSFPSAFDSMDDLKNMVYFNYLDEKDWGKRILAKLTHDLEADNP